MRPMRCEIQIRTLLQHAWGELTHEDTYKPGVKVPDLVQVLSKRLATTLAVMDEIAQDLRNELDKLERLETQTQVPGETPAARLGESSDEQLIAPTVQEKSVALAGEKTETAQPLKPSREDLRGAFLTAYGKELTLSDEALEAVLNELGSAGLVRAQEIAAALKESKEALQALESQYKKVHLNDLGRVRAARLFRESLEKATAWVKETLGRATEQATAKKTQAEDFTTSYPTGKETLGTVVYVAPDYALVQLPEGAQASFT